MIAECGKFLYLCYIWLGICKNDLIATATSYVKQFITLSFYKFILVSFLENMNIYNKNIFNIFVEKKHIEIKRKKFTR